MRNQKLTVYEALRLAMVCSLSLALGATYGIYGGWPVVVAFLLMAAVSFAGAVRSR